MGNLYCQRLLRRTSTERCGKVGASGENPMADAPDDQNAPAGETPIQRALRLKKAAIAAKQKPPRGGKFQREQAAAHASSSKSKPWMSR